jgi:hypothetical protein
MYQLEKLECCPACGEKLSQVEYDLQHHRCGWNQPGGNAMVMHAFTPGPWAYDRDFFQVFVKGDADPAVIATIDSDVALAGLEQAHADGRLIAAAPELLAALKGMVEEFEKFSRYGSTLAREANAACHAARTAVAKAEGAGL